MEGHGMSGIANVAERRRYPRVKMDGVIRVGRNGRRSLEVTGRDISLSGCSFYASESVKYETDEWVDVTVTPPKDFVDSTFDSPCRVKGRIVREENVTRSKNGNQKCVALEFERTLEAIVERIYTGRRVVTLILMPLVLLSLFALKLVAIRYYWYEPIVYAYGLVVTGYILSRFLLALFYRPPKDSGYYPTVSIVIPVKNDEAIIGETIRRCFHSKYPPNRIEVLVVDDGSTDRTLDEIYKIKDEFPELIVISFGQNRGKRHAMAEGTRRARGQIIVYMDSDSLLSSDDSIYYLVQGFSDPSVGAISGHTNVLNTDDNMLTKMQEVRYFLAFRVMKAAESVFSLVTCCSGPLSAYRKKCVMRVLDSWLDQRFLGRRATFGDDRSLTRRILKHNKVLYDNRATIETVVPSGWNIFLKQQMRWKRSWFRENLLTASFMWWKIPFGAISFYLGCILPLVSPFVVLFALIYKPVFQGQLPMHYVAGLSLISLLWGFTYRLCRPNKKWFFAIHLCVFYVFVLSWQTYFAVLTSYKNHWGTR